MKRLLELRHNGHLQVTVGVLIFAVLFWLMFLGTVPPLEAVKAVFTN